MAVLEGPCVPHAEYSASLKVVFLWDKFN